MRVDPVKTNTKSAPQTTTLPRTTRDLFVAASNGQVLAFDNLSQLSANISDALCMISTGGGYTKRRGFTDTGQIHITGSRPIILAGTSNTITRSDLADRVIILQPLPIDPTKRRTDVDLQREFEAIRPKILGALLTCLSSCLRRLPNVLPDSLPRMADFFKLGIAFDDSLRGTSPGDFERAWSVSTQEARGTVLEADCVGLAVQFFMVDRDQWSGTAMELWCKLKTTDGHEARPTQWPSWPRTSMAATLGQEGLAITFGRAVDRRRTRTIEITKIKLRPRRTVRTTKMRANPLSIIRLPLFG